jgi:hypothetical protein
MFNCKSTGREKQTVTGNKHWALQLKGEDYLEDLDVDGEIILKWIVTERQDVGRIRLAQNTNYTRAEMNTGRRITPC